MKSVVSYPGRGPYGKSDYRGNTSGLPIRDLIQQFQPKKPADYMVGGGTFVDVCKDLGINNYIAHDLNPAWGGFNAMTDDIDESCDFIFWHPPYWDIIKYSGNMWGNGPDSRDLSQIARYPDFIKSIDKIQAKFLASLRKGGRLVMLVGDIKKNGMLYSMQKDMAWFGKPEQVIIKLQHNCFSDSKEYTGNFIPIVHEYIVVMKRDHCYLVNAKQVTDVQIDLRTRTKITWRDVVHAALEALGGSATLDKLYAEINGHAKCNENPHWKEKVRQTLQITNDFVNLARGEWAFNY